MKISPRSLIMGLAFAGLFFVFATQTASADNTPGVYSVQTPQGNYSVTYSSWMSNMRTFTISKPGTQTSSYRVSTTVGFWEMKINGTVVCTVTLPAGTTDPLISPAYGESFFWSEAEADPSIYVRPYMSTVRQVLERDMNIMIAMTYWVSDAEHVWAGYVLTHGSHQARAMSQDLVLAGYVVITQPPNSSNGINDTFAGCTGNCRLMNFGCASEAMCILGCETIHHMTDVAWRADCPSMLPPPMY